MLRILKKKTLDDLYGDIAARDEEIERLEAIIEKDATDLRVLCERQKVLRGFIGEDLTVRLLSGDLELEGNPKKL